MEEERRRIDRAWEAQAFQAVTLEAGLVLEACHQVASLEAGLVWEA